MEDLHCRINLATHLKHTIEVAKADGVHLDSVVEGVLGFKRPALH